MLKKIIKIVFVIVCVLQIFYVAHFRSGFRVEILKNPYVLKQKSKPGSCHVTITFWNKDFFGNDQLNHDLSDVTFTFDDAYSLIFLPATKDLYTFYLRKEDIYFWF